MSRAYKLESPRDLQEQARLDLQHEVWLLSLDGSLRAAAIPATFEPDSILDLGCGSGTWAVSYALAYPKSQVVAMDIEPPLKQKWPTNLRVVSNSVDAEQEDQWPQGEMFDYIHLRMLTFALRNYAAVLEICWKHLNVGGWIEIDDAHLPYAAENMVANAETSVFLRCSYLQIQAQANNGIDALASQRHIDRLKLLGFDNVSQTTIKWPVNGKWPEDEKHKQIGTMTGSNWQQMWSRFGPLILSTKLSMSKIQAADVCDRVLQESRDDLDMHYYFPIEGILRQHRSLRMLIESPQQTYNSDKYAMDSSLTRTDACMTIKFSILDNPSPTICRSWATELMHITTSLSAAPMLNQSSYAVSDKIVLIE